MHHTTVVLSLVLFSAAWSGRAYAEPITFNFGASVANLTKYSDTQLGVTMTLTREGGTAFEIATVAGRQRLGPLSGGTTSNTAFVADFSAPLSSFLIMFGDFHFRDDPSSSDLDTLLIQAYSGAGATGTLLDTFTITCCFGIPPDFVFPGNDFFNSAFGSVASPGIASVRFIGGSELAPNSGFYDRITVNSELPAPVPEPASMLLLGTGLLGIAFRRSRRKRN